MTTATVHHLPGAATTLEDQVRALQPGQWVRVTWHDKLRNCSGVVQGTVVQPSHLVGSLFVGDFCLRLRSRHVNADVTSIETTKRPDLDMEELAERMGDWAEAMQALEDKPVGHFKTGDNTAEANRVYVAEQYVREYLRSVQL